MTSHMIECPEFGQAVANGVLPDEIIKRHKIHIRKPIDVIIEMSYCAYCKRPLSVYFPHTWNDLLQADSVSTNTTKST